MRVSIPAIILLIALLAQNAFTRILPDYALHGKKPVPPPSLSYSSFIAGDFQRDFEQWLKSSLGLSGALTKLNNEMSYLFFNELAFNKGILVGRNSSLISKTYVDSYLGRDLLSEKELDKKVSSIRELQDVLKGHNIQLILALTPSKASIYPELLPDWILRHRKQGFVSNYERLLPLLASHGVNYLDGRELAVMVKDDGKVPSFTRGGIHWTHPTGFLFVQRLIEKMESLSGKRLPRAVLNEFTKTDDPIIDDIDMALLTNMLYEKRFYEGRYDYFNYSLDAGGHSHYPSILFEGGSFLEIPISYFKYGGLTRNYYYLNYFHNTHIMSAMSDKDKLLYEDLSSEPSAVLSNIVLSQDFVVLEANEAALSNIGSGFVEAALGVLKQ